MAAPHVAPILLFVLPAAPSCPQPGAEWVVALYDFAGNSEGDLSFQQGDRILVSRHIDCGWSCGHLDGREGIFPTAFVESAGMTEMPEILQVLAIKTLFCHLIFTLWTILECLPFYLSGFRIHPSRLHVFRQFVCQSGPRPPEETAALRGRALYDFASDSDEELSLQVWRCFGFPV